MLHRVMGRNNEAARGCNMRAGWVGSDKSRIIGVGKSRGIMGQYYAVKQGEYLSMLAERYGFASYKTIWNDPKNAELKKKRGNPNVLFPGDQLFIPSPEPESKQCPTDLRHRFLFQGEWLKLKLVLENPRSKAIAHTECLLQIDGQSFQLSTDSQGRIEQKIPRLARRGQIIIKKTKDHIKDLVIEFKIGHLDPVEEKSGQLGRLANLGYYRGSLNGNGNGANDREFSSALEEFQCDFGLKVDGVCGKNTQAKLVEVHGS